MAARSAKGRPSGPPAAPESVEEALARFRDHGRAALSETVAALQALLDAATLAVTGKAAERDAFLGPVSRSLEELRGMIAPDSSRVGGSLLDALFDALDAEISRWEVRSHEDPNARSVLRAFLGVREILWEIQARGGAAAAEATAPETDRKEPSARPARSRRGTRVQRVEVEG